MWHWHDERGCDDDESYHQAKRPVFCHVGGQGDVGSPNREPHQQKRDSDQQLPPDAWWALMPYVPRDVVGIVSDDIADFQDLVADNVAGSV